MSANPPSVRRRAFVDTSAFFAISNARDVQHPIARAIANHLRRGNWNLSTSNRIVAETHALLLARAGRHVAATTLAEIDRGDITIIRVSEVDEQRAREIIYQYDDKEFSLTDATSFAVMERLHIPFAFAFDHHFTQLGMTLISPSQEQ
jgi:predicted nucleic acid-binding protein